MAPEYRTYGSFNYRKESPLAARDNRRRETRASKKVASRGRAASGRKQRSPLKGLHMRRNKRWSW